MPFVPATNVIQAELIYNWDGEICENVLHYQSQAGATQDAIVELGAWLVTWFDTHLQPNISEHLSLTNIKLTDLSSENGVAFDYAIGLPLQGGAQGDSLPNNCALVFSKRTMFRGRSYRGRIYMPGLCEAFVAGNSVISAARGPILDAWQELLAPNTVLETWTLVVVSRIHNGVERASAVVTYVSNITTDWGIDSQRRRLPGRGS